MSGYSHMFGLFEGDGTDIPSNLQDTTTFPQYSQAKCYEASANLSATTSLPNHVLPYPLLADS